jgi:glycyl-tRNA synthetase beta chain
MAPELEQGFVTAEIFESVRVRRPVSPLDFYQRLTAVHRFMQLDTAESLAIANKRIANILRSADEEPDGEIDPGLFDAAEERALHEAVTAISSAHRKGLDNRDYGGVLEGLAALKEPVDAYFDGVMVMDEDPAKRRNRLGTLNQLRQLFLDVADIGRIPRT